MAKLELTKENVYDLIDKVNSSDINELTFNDGQSSITIKKEEVKVISHNESNSSLTVVDTKINETNSDDKVVKAPIIGTFYSCPSPDKPPFVEVGSKVKVGDVLFIIESMKLMNEVKSEFDGIVDKILVESGDSVEYGQPIIKLK